MRSSESSIILRAVSSNALPLRRNRLVSMEALITRIAMTAGLVSRKSTERAAATPRRKPLRIATLRSSSSTRAIDDVADPPFSDFVTV